MHNKVYTPKNISNDFQLVSSRDVFDPKFDMIKRREFFDCSELLNPLRGLSSKYINEGTLFKHEYPCQLAFECVVRKRNIAHEKG